MKLNNKNQKFLALIEVVDNQIVKVNKAQKLTSVNQYKNKWLDINARNFSRALNHAEIIIK